MKFPEKLKHFIKEQDWIFAKTYAETWPHEYIVQERVDSEMFLKLADHIASFGYENYLYKMKQIYFDNDGYTYWHMENIINRCVEKDTYHNRKKEGRLPEDKRK